MIPSIVHNSTDIRHCVIICGLASLRWLLKIVRESFLSLVPGSHPFFFLNHFFPLTHVFFIFLTFLSLSFKSSQGVWGMLLPPIVGTGGTQLSNSVRYFLGWVSVVCGRSTILILPLILYCYLRFASVLCAFATICNSWFFQSTCAKLCLASAANCGTNLLDVVRYDADLQSLSMSWNGLWESNKNKSAKD